MSSAFISSKISLVKLLVAFLTCAPIVQYSHADNLRNIYELARANDPRILASDFERRAAQLDIPIAKAAKRPNVSLSLSQGFEYDSDFTSEEDNFTEPSLMLSVPVYSRRNNVNVTLALAGVEEAELAFIQQEQALFLRTAELYFGVLRAKDGVEIAQTALEAFESQVALASELVAERLVSSSDEQEARASLDSATASLIEAKNQLSAAEEGLRVAIGRNPPTLAAISDNVPLEPPTPDNADAWVEMGLLNNPTLRLTQLQLRSAVLRIDQARSEYYPTVDFQSSYTYTESDRGATEDRNFGEIRLNVNVPIYQGGAVKARTAQADLRRALTTQQLSFTQRGVEQQIRNAFANVATSIGRARALEQAVVSNEDSLEGIRFGVEVQTRTIVDLLDATNRLATSRVELSGARYDYLMNLLALQSFAGELSLDDLSGIDRWLRG